MSHPWFRSISQHLAAAKQRLFPAHGYFRHQSQYQLGKTLAKHYRVSSTASIEALWQKMNDLAGLGSWHPLVRSTNAPNGQQAKPGLIYRVFTRRIPVPVKIFVESVLPQQRISVRAFPVPGLEERVIYRIDSTLCGTQISYSIELRGWLSPLAWSFIRPYAAQVARALAQAAEQMPPQPQR